MKLLIKQVDEHKYFLSDTQPPNSEYLCYYDFNDSIKKLKATTLSTIEPRFEIYSHLHQKEKGKFTVKISWQNYYSEVNVNRTLMVNSDSNVYDIIVRKLYDSLISSFYKKKTVT